MKRMMNGRSSRKKSHCMLVLRKKYAPACATGVATDRVQGTRLDINAVRVKSVSRTMAQVGGERPMTRTQKEKLMETAVGSWSADPSEGQGGLRRRPPSFEGNRYAREALEHLPPRLCGKGDRRAASRGRAAVEGPIGQGIQESTYEDQAGVNAHNSTPGNRMPIISKEALDEMGRRIIPEEITEQYFRDTGVDPGTPDSTEARTMGPATQDLYHGRQECQGVSVGKVSPCFATKRNVVAEEERGVCHCTVEHHLAFGQSPELGDGETWVLLHY